MCDGVERVVDARVLPVGTRGGPLPLVTRWMLILQHNDVVRETGGDRWWYTAHWCATCAHYIPLEVPVGCGILGVVYELGYRMSILCVHFLHWRCCDADGSSSSSSIIILEKWLLMYVEVVATVMLQ